MAQVALSPVLSAQVEVRTRHTEQGDLRLDFDPTQFSRDNRFSLDQDTGRIGLRFAVAPGSTILVSAAYYDRDERRKEFGSIANLDSQFRDQGHQVEAQWLYRRGGANFVFGAGSYDISGETKVSVDFTPSFGAPCPGLPPGACDLDRRYPRRLQNAYAYLTAPLAHNLSWTIGASAEHYQDGEFVRDVVNPKFGFVWDPARLVQVRGAAFRTLKPVRVADQTIEPTQVAGFNQLFDDFNGTLAERYALGIELRPSSTLRFGIAGMTGHISYPLQDPTTNALLLEEPFDERRARAYAFWAPAKHWAVTAEPEFERLERAGTFASDDPIQLRTYVVPVFIRYFTPSGFFATLGATHVRQSVSRLPTSTLAVGSDNFTLVDGAIGFWLPSRRGLITLEGKNLFDEHFSFQDLNFQTSEPQPPRFLPARTVLLRLTLAF